MTFTAWALVSTLAFGQATPATPPAPAEPKPAAQAPQAQVDAESLPVSVDRIQRALAQTPRIRPSEVTPVFRVEVLGKLPPIEVLLGADYLVGKTPAAGMTHQEFLNMVTPPEFRGTAMFTQGEAMTIMATATLLQWTLQKAVQKYRDATRESEREAARKEVEEALAALDKARTAAGLPKR
jgi:hypothetical protein